MAEKTTGRRKKKTSRTGTSTARSRSSSQQKARKSTRKKARSTARWWIVATVCCGLALAAALLLLVTEPRSPTPTVDNAALLNQALMAQLYQLNVPYENVRKSKGHPTEGEQRPAFGHWEITLPDTLPPQSVLAKLQQRARDVCPEAAIASARRSDDSWELQVQVGDRVTHHLILRPTVPKPPPPPPPSPVLPRVAIVVDDLGLDRKAARALLALDAPLTFSLLPGRPFSHEIAEKTHARGREIMLHLPMEPRGYPLKDPGTGALFVSMTDDEIAKQVDENLNAVPYAAGVNNHMGSRFMEHEGKVRVMMERLKARNLFFLDSLTTAQSAGEKAARACAVRLVKRDVFLDNESDVKDVKHQIDKLIRVAKANGSAVGICHPYPATIKALQEKLPEIMADGRLELVSASQIIP